MNELAPRPSQHGFPRHGPVSLWDMVKKFDLELVQRLQLVQERAKETLRMDASLAGAKPVNAMLQALVPSASEAKPVSSANVLKMMQVMHFIARDFDLEIVRGMIDDTRDNPPQTDRELAFYYNLLMKELYRHLFISIPPSRSEYWDNPDVLSDEVKGKFPEESEEVRRAGTAFACGMWDATVFHAMRAAELGMRKLGLELGVTFPHGDITLEQWLTVIKQMEKKIKEMDQLPKSTEKSSKQEYYASAAMQFRCFKDGYRIQAFHAKAYFDEKSALSVLTHTIDFFETLAIEKPVSSDDLSRET